MKKFLSMVLAMVMTLSLVTVSAGAKEFPDNDQLTGDADGVYAEAVNVLSEMGIIDGDTDGNFKPKGTLTRGAASKIIACMRLGKTTAESLGTAAAPFKDVPVGSTFAGYIAYCVEQGIINGYADGTFRPSGALTGYAFQKMLLTALGYDSAIEGYANNPNWRVNVAGRAQQEGLLKGLDASNYSAAEAATREQACLMALNTIKTPLVEYENKGSTLTVNGATISQSASAVKYVTTVDQNRATAIDTKQYQTAQTGQQASYFVEFGEQYQPDLRRVRTTDNFGRPAYTWTWQKDEIDTYVDYSILLGEYNTGVTGRALRELIGQTAIDEAFDHGDFAYWVDGVEYDPDSGNAQKIDHVDLLGIKKTDLVRGNEKDAGMTKNGVLTQVFLDKDHGPWELTITSVDTWLAKANADYSTSTEEVSVTVYTEKTADEATGTKSMRIDVEDVPEIESVKKDDYILVTRSGKDTTDGSLRIVGIKDVEILSDSTVTQFSKGDKRTASADARAIDKLTTGGTEYNFSQKCYYNAEALDEYDRSLLTNMTYDVYLDEYGYVIGVAVHEGNRNYAFITAYDQSNTTIISRSTTATAIFLDGSIQDITVNTKDTNINIANAKSKNLPDQEYCFSEWKASGSAQHNRWYTYTVNTAGVYTLRPAERMLIDAVDRFDSDGKLTLNSANLYLKARKDNQEVGIFGSATKNIGTSKTKADSTRAYGNDASIYITVETEKLNASTNTFTIDDVNGVYTGAQNVKLDINKGTGIPEYVYALYDSDNYIIAAIVIGQAQGSISNYAYILDDAKSEKYEDGYYYWTFEGVQNGEKKTFTARSKFSETIEKLTPYHVQQLIFDGEYVSRITDISREKFYVDNTVPMGEKGTHPDKPESKVDVYDVGHLDGVMDDCGDREYLGYDGMKASDLGTNNGTQTGRLVGTISIIGGTLYVDPTDGTGKNTDTGLAIRSNAKAVLIQRYNGNREVTEHSSVQAAIDAMADLKANVSGKQFQGRIVAGLNSGVAQWVIIISDTAVRNGQAYIPGGNENTERTGNRDITGLVTGRATVNIGTSWTTSQLNVSDVLFYVNNDGSLRITLSGKAKDYTHVKGSTTMGTDQVRLTINGSPVTLNWNTVDNSLVGTTADIHLNSSDVVILNVNELFVKNNPGTEFEVTLNYNGSDTPSKTTKHPFGTVISTVVDANPTWDGHTFQYWSTDAQGRNRLVTDTTKNDAYLTKNITLYAWWETKQTSVDPSNPIKPSGTGNNGGTIVPDNNDKPIQGIDTSTSAVKTDEVKVVIGVDPNAEQAVKVKAIYYTFNVNGRLYRAKLANLKPDADGNWTATGIADEDVLDENGNPVTLASLNINKDYVESQYKADAANGTAKITIDAENVAKYTVTFNANAPAGATVSGMPASQTVISGEKAKAPTTNPTCTDYVFDKWTAADGTEFNFDNAITANTTISAQWKKVPATAIALNTEKLNLVVDANDTLTATLTPADSTDKVTWESSNTAVATVDANGKVTAVKAGEAIITATANETVKATCTVNVTDNAVPATGITLDKETLTLVVKETGELNATVEPDTSTDKVTWTSSDTAIATVDATGKVTAVATGTATITAKAGDQTATCKVTVTAEAVEYNITIATAANGTVKAQAGDTAADVAKATAGTEVTIVATPEDGYKVDTITVTDADNGDVTVTNGKFTMPAKNVTVTVTFVENDATEYNITITDPTNGTVTTTPATKAAAGTEVTITATPEDGYKVDTITVKDADNGDVTLTGNKFTMPAKAVTVTVTFVEKVASLDIKVATQSKDVSVGATQAKTAADLIDSTLALTTPDTSKPNELAVTGKVKYVSGWTEFSSDATEQSGYYLPLTITLKDAAAADVTISVTGSGTAKTIELDEKSDPSAAANDQVLLIMYLNKLVEANKKIQVTLTPKSAGTTPTTYTVDVSALTTDDDAYLTITTATLHDTSDTDPVADDALFTADSYKVESVSYGVLKSTATIVAKEIAEHQNGDDPTARGYWIGATFAPADKDTYAVLYKTTRATEWTKDWEDTAHGIFATMYTQGVEDATKNSSNITIGVFAKTDLESDGSLKTGAKPVFEKAYTVQASAECTTKTATP